MKPKHLRETTQEEKKRAKRIYILFVVIVLLITVVLCVALLFTISEPQRIESPKPVYIGRKIIDRRYTPPDCYELLYFTGYDNGFGVEQWKEVSREEYERTKIDVRPEN